MTYLRRGGIDTPFFLSNLRCVLLASYFFEILISHFVFHIYVYNTATFIIHITLFLFTNKINKLTNIPMDPSNRFTQNLERLRFSLIGQYQIIRQLEISTAYFIEIMYRNFPQVFKRHNYSMYVK